MATIRDVMPAFELFQPTSVDAALALLDEHGADAWVLLSNVLWIVWAWHVQAWALIALQVGLFAMNVRGAVKNE